MRDYWLIQYLLAAVGWGYAALVAVTLVLVLWLVKGRIAKTIVACIVLGLASILPIKSYQCYLQEKEQAEAFKARYAKAKAMFDERCKTAGEKIYRTVEGVEGVLLDKIRPKEINLSDQYRLDDPFGSDCHGEECIADLLRVTTGSEHNRELAARLENGFSFVDVVDPADGQGYRYRAVIEAGTSHRLTLNRITSNAQPTPFSITWDDISTHEDRDNWIAGGVLKVIDKKSGEIMGERRGYMMDKGQGNQDGGRSPWAYAYDNACPKLPTVSDGRAIRVGHSRKFVLSILKSQERK